MTYSRAGHVLIKQKPNLKCISRATAFNSHQRGFHTCLCFFDCPAELLSVISCYGGGLESNKTIQVSWPAQHVSAQTTSAISREGAAQAVLTFICGSCHPHAA